MNLATAPMLDGREIQVALAAARLAGKTFVRATYVRECPACGKVAMLQDGALATGLPLDLYVPEVGEVLKNHVMYCQACGFDQAS